MTEHELHYYNAVIHFNEGDYAAAIEEINTAIRQHRNFGDYYFFRASLLKETGQYEKAIADYRYCIYLEPQAADAHNNIGQIYFDQHEYDKAVPWFQQALAINSLLPQSLCNLGHIYYSRGETRKALQHYYKSVLYNPDYLKAYSDLGHLYRTEDRPRKSYEMMLQLLENYPGIVSFRTERAYCTTTLRLLGDIDTAGLHAARADMEALFSENPGEETAFLAAQLNLDTEDFSKALYYINYALEANPENELYLNIRGMCYSETGEYDKAISEFNTALKINPANCSSWYNRAISNWRKGQVHEAARDFLKAREEGLLGYPRFMFTLLQFFNAGALYYQQLVTQFPNWAAVSRMLNMETLQRCDTVNRLLYLLHHQLSEAQAGEIIKLRQMELAIQFHMYHFPACITLYQEHFASAGITNAAADFYYLYSLYMTRHNQYEEIQLTMQQQVAVSMNKNSGDNEVFYGAAIYLLCGNEVAANNLLSQYGTGVYAKLLYHLLNITAPQPKPELVIYPINLVTENELQPDVLFSLLPSYELMQLFPGYQHEFAPGTDFPELLQTEPIAEAARNLAKKQFFSAVETAIADNMQKPPSEQKEDFYTSYTMRNCFNELEREQDERLQALTVSLIIKDGLLPQDGVYRLIGFFYNNGRLSLRHAVSLYFYSLKYAGKTKKPVTETFVEKMIENNLKEILTGYGAYLVSKSVEIAVISATTAKFYTARLKKYLEENTTVPYDEFCNMLEENLFSTYEVLGENHFRTYYPAAQMFQFA